MTLTRGVGYSIAEARSLMLDAKLWPKPITCPSSWVVSSALAAERQLALRFGHASHRLRGERQHFFRHRQHHAAVVEAVIVAAGPVVGVYASK